jgi:ribosomal protein L20
MRGMTISATDMVNLYTAAEQAVLKGQEFSLGDRKLRRADLAEIRAGRIEWEAKLLAEQSRAARRPSIGGLTFRGADLSGD